MDLKNFLAWRCTQILEVMKANMQSGNANDAGNVLVNAKIVLA
jgi:hypothetical protein